VRLGSSRGGEANAGLTGLAASFPRAWIGPRRRTRCKSREPRVERGGVSGRAEVRGRAPAARSQHSPAALPPERIEELRAEARKALIAGDYETAIRTTPPRRGAGDHRAEARERLGIAREKNGQTAYAAPSIGGSSRNTRERSGVPSPPASDNLVAGTSHERLRSEETGRGAGISRRACRSTTTGTSIASIRISRSSRRSPGY